MKTLPLLFMTGGWMLLGGWLLCRWQEKRRQIRQRLTLCYLRVLLHGSDHCNHLPLICHPEARRALAEAVAGLCRSTCGCDIDPLRKVVRQYDLDRWVRRRLSRSVGIERWEWWALWACLPTDEQTPPALRQSEHRAEGFWQTLLRLRKELTSPESILYRRSLPLSSAEFRLLTALLPEAREQLRQEADSSLLLRIACDRHLPLDEATCRNLSPRERRALLRRAAWEGYSLRGAEPLMTNELRPAFERLAASYKSAALWS